MLSMPFSPLSPNKDGLRLLEPSHFGDDDPIPFLETRHDLHLADADGPDFDGPESRKIPVENVGLTAAAVLEERPAGDLEHVRPTVDQEADRDTLVLPEPLGRSPVEPHEAAHFAAADLR